MVHGFNVCRARSSGVDVKPKSLGNAGQALLLEWLDLPGGHLPPAPLVSA